MMNIKKGIDISNHNGEIDFSKLKEQGIDFAILRTGYGQKFPRQYDKKFEEYYAQCKKYGIDVGAYHFSYALTEEAVLKEADFMLEILQGKQFEYPIYYDIETTAHTTLSKAVCDELVTAFCTKLEQAGYFAGVYSFDSFFGSNLTSAIPKRFATWVARVEYVKPTFIKDYGMWQYSWKGDLDGVPTDIDLNEVYVDYPSIIKKKNLNGFVDENGPIYKVSAFTEERNKAKAEIIAQSCRIMGMSVKEEVIE